MIGNVSNARANYYDRTATAWLLSYAASGVAPHATTVRATRTVATGKKSYIEAGQFETIRVTAAAPVGRYRSMGTISATVLAQAASFLNAVNDRDYQTAGQLGLVQAGIDIEIRTQDLSTGGTVTYEGTLKGVDFDA